MEDNQVGSQNSFVFVTGAGHNITDQNATTDWQFVAKKDDLIMQLGGVILDRHPVVVQSLVTPTWK